MHIHWTVNKPYVETKPYTTTDFTNFTFNINKSNELTLYLTSVLLKPGDTVHYWLMILSELNFERHIIHNLYFKVKEKNCGMLVADVGYTLPEVDLAD